MHHQTMNGWLDPNAACLFGGSSVPNHKQTPSPLLLRIILAVSLSIQNALHLDNTDSHEFPCHQ
jgi:hypothetical protein